jgi:hypothetical protein
MVLALATPYGQPGGGYGVARICPMHGVHV